MRLVLSVPAFLLLLAFPGSVEASCFFNKAICQAICEKDCCDNLAIETPANPAQLRSFQIQDLMSEFTQAERRGARDRFQTILQAEIERRRTVRGTKPAVRSGGGTQLRTQD